MVGARRFKLLTLCAQGRCATRLRYAPTESRQKRRSATAIMKEYMERAAVSASGVALCEQ